LSGRAAKPRKQSNSYWIEVRTQGPPEYEEALVNSWPGGNQSFYTYNGCYISNGKKRPTKERSERERKKKRSAWWRYV